MSEQEYWKEGEKEARKEIVELVRENLDQLENIIFNFENILADFMGKRNKYQGIRALEEIIKIYPNRVVSVYNCNNCKFRDKCKVIRVDYGKNENALRNYTCHDHSHF